MKKLALQVLVLLLVVAILLILDDVYYARYWGVIPRQGAGTILSPPQALGWGVFAVIVLFIGIPCLLILLDR